MTEQELEIMKIVWERETATVRDVYEALLERRKVAYTTVMTMMKILEQKKYLKNQADRAYVYRPAQPKGQVIGAMVRDFVNRVFNGSAEPLLVHLVEDQQLSRKDLEEITHMIRRKEALMSGLWLQNLAFYSLQIAGVAAAGALLLRMLQIRCPTIRLMPWQALIAACLALPAIQPWLTAKTNANVQISMGPAMAAGAARGSRGMAFPGHTGNRSSTGGSGRIGPIRDPWNRTMAAPDNIGAIPRSVPGAFDNLQRRLAGSDLRLGRVQVEDALK